MVRVKSIQCFKQSLSTAEAGDRIAVGVGTAIDPAQIERCLVWQAGSISYSQHLLISCQRVRFHKNSLPSRTRLHLSILHETVQANCIFIHSEEGELLEELGETDCLAILELTAKVPCAPGMLVIGSRLDADLTTKACRLAFSGEIIALDPKIRLFRWKERTAQIDRIVNEYRLIGRGLISNKDGRLDKFIGMNITIGEGLIGKIESPFGTSGKFNVTHQSAKIHLSDKLTLRYKKYL